MPAEERTKLNPDIMIRHVYSSNLDSEFALIRRMIDLYPIVSMDTEFPGTIVHPDSTHRLYRLREPTAIYSYLKANVDALKLIQIGITLSDAKGNLPTLGTENSYVWEFNFKDFDFKTDRYAPESLSLLEKQGIDFQKNLEQGSDIDRFAELMFSSGLVMNESVTWVTFHSGYDFGYLIKYLRHKNLPERLCKFYELVRVYFGPRVYDVKYLMRYCDSLYGGLDRLCQALNVRRLIGKSHQAGSDSLVTLQAFMKLKKIYFPREAKLEKHANVLYGLETSKASIQ